MLMLAVVAERLAVVGDEGDDGPVEERPLAQAVEEAADERVRVGHLAVVRARGEALAEG